MIKSRVNNAFFSGNAYFKNTNDFNKFYYWFTMFKGNNATFETIEGLKDENISNAFLYTFKNSLYPFEILFSFETVKERKYFISMIEEHEKRRI